MRTLFVYGTLMFDEVSSRLLKGRYQYVNVTLDDYKRFKIIGEIYPGLSSFPGSKVDGLLITGLSDNDIKLLDRFEGPYYKRIRVKVRDADGGYYETEVYCIRRKYQNRLSRKEWCSDRFRKQFLGAFLKSYRHW